MPEAGKHANHNGQDKLTELLAAGVVTNYSDQGKEKNPV